MTAPRLRQIADHALLCRQLIHAIGDPTIVMLTDRTDLDEQLFGTLEGKELFPQTPAKANSRRHLRELLRVNAGGVVFTTIQKFFQEEGEDDHPLLTERSNVIVMADEASLAVQLRHQTRGNRPVRAQFSPKHSAHRVAERDLCRLHRHSARTLRSRYPHRFWVITLICTISATQSKTKLRFHLLRIAPK